MKLSFLILGYKELAHIRLNIKNILDLNLNFDYEIIYADNGSINGCPEMVEELYPSVKVVRNGGNLGHPAGNNGGLRVAKGEYVAMINPDIILRSAEDIYKIIDYMDQEKDIAILGPKLQNPDGSVQNTCYRRYSLFTPVYRRTFLGKLPFGKKDINRHLMMDFDHQESRDVDWLLGACFFIRRKAMNEVGIMSEKMFLYFGDYEWCDRFWANGWRIHYYANTNGIFHYHNRESASSRFTIPQLFSRMTRIHIKDWISFLKIQNNNVKST